MKPLKQGIIKEDDNKDNKTEEVEDKDMKDQDDIENHNVNINCKENDNDVYFNIIKHKIRLKMKSLLTTIIKKIKVVE